MSDFLFPVSLGEKIEWMMNSSWWGTSRRGWKSTNWLCLEKLTMHKNKWANGLSKYSWFNSNLAMLGKQRWRLITYLDALISHIFKAKYYPRIEFLEAKLSYNPSYTWRIIWNSQPLVKEGSWWLEMKHLLRFGVTLH